jgi:hypothetical protein
MIELHMPKVYYMHNILHKDEKFYMQNRHLEKQPFKISNRINTNDTALVDAPIEEQQLQPVEAINPVPFMSLELYVKIFSLLPLKDLLSVTLVNPFFNIEAIWNGILISHFPAWNNESALLKEPNIHFKLEYKHNFAKLSFPNLYLSNTLNNINDVFKTHKIDFVTLININAMNNDQKEALEALFIFLCDRVIKSSFCRFSLFSSPVKDIKNRIEANTASTLMKVALKKEHETILDKCAESLIEEYQSDTYNEKLATIYINLIKARLISKKLEGPKNHYPKNWLL